MIVGNIEDNFKENAVKDGFETISIEDAVKKSNISFILIPDEIMKEVFERSIKPNLKEGDAIVFASGYNVGFDEKFLREWFIRNDHKYFGAYFNNQCIDIIRDVDKLIYLSNLVLENRKLETVCKHFNVKIDAHDAFSDIVATRKLAPIVHEELKKYSF